MSTSRKTAVIVGVLFIIGTIAWAAIGVAVGVTGVEQARSQRTSRRYGAPAAKAA